MIEKIFINKIKLFHLKFFKDLLILLNFFLIAKEEVLAHKENAIFFFFYRFVKWIMHKIRQHQIYKKISVKFLLKWRTFIYIFLEEGVGSGVEEHIIV